MPLPLLASVLVLLGLPGSVPRPAESAGDARCRQAPLWCDPKMVALRIEDSRGEIEVRAENGALISWRRPGWRSSISIKATRRGRGRVRIQVFMPSPQGLILVADRELTKRASLEVAPPSWAPGDVFGPPGSSARIICDE